MNLVPQRFRGNKMILNYSTIVLSEGVVNDLLFIINQEPPFEDFQVVRLWAVPTAP